MDKFYLALDAAHRSVDDGGINEFITRTDEYGFRAILAHSDRFGWFTWFDESDD